MKSLEGHTFCLPIFCMAIISLLGSGLAFPQDQVVVVHNSKNPSALPGLPSTLVLKEDLVIGKDMAKEDYRFSGVNALAVDNSGNIYVVDPKDIRIRVFDSKGRFLRAFGRKGQGPGEFQGPGDIEVTPDGLRVIQDVLNNRVSYLTPKGESIKDVPNKWMGSFLRTAAAGGYYLAKSELQGDKLVFELCKTDSDQKPVLTLCSFERVVKKTAWSPFEEICYFEVMNKTNLIWLISSTYEMHIVAPSGQTIKRIIKDYDPLKITQADKERIRRSYSSPSLPGEPKLELPEYYPAVNGLVVDDQDWIYVQTFAKDKRGRLFHDVFEPGGHYVARFSLPEDETVVVVKAKKLYCLIRESEEGIPLVKRYALEWK